ncbi:MAG: hypothetical protein H6626_03820 [Pseudobdellovibrionaceae bacterium]|nr:hypothetical protein [Bdellovibrionales bacterium]USN48226.1 MAG: hypothetical protein H6626_03820 [Pseudobdellovibrionaceae bacterium]
MSLPGELLSSDTRSDEFQSLISEAAGELPESLRRLIRKRTLAIGLAELGATGEVEQWGSINGEASLCAASTMKITCALGALAAEAEGYLQLSDTRPTSPASVDLGETIFVNTEDIKSSLIYHRPGGFRDGNRDAGKVCRAINEAYLRHVGGGRSPNTYDPCWLNDQLRQWGFHGEGPEGLWLGLLYGSGARCSVPQPEKTYGLPSLTTQRASVNGLLNLWAAVESNNFSNLSSVALKWLKDLIGGSKAPVGYLGRAFCRSGEQCLNLYGKTGTLTWRTGGLRCRNDARVVVHPKDPEKRLVMAVMCNTHYNEGSCTGQDLSVIAEKIRSRLLSN